LNIIKIISVRNYNIYQIRLNDEEWKKQDHSNGDLIFIVDFHPRNKVILNLKKLRRS